MKQSMQGDQTVGHNNLGLGEEDSEKNFSEEVILSPVLTKEWEMAKIWRIGKKFGGSWICIKRNSMQRGSL